MIEITLKMFAELSKVLPEVPNVAVYDFLLKFILLNKQQLKDKVTTIGFAKKVNALYGDMLDEQLITLDALIERKKSGMEVEGEVCQDDEAILIDVVRRNLIVRQKVSEAYKEHFNEDNRVFMAIYRKVTIIWEATCTNSKQSIEIDMPLAGRLVSTIRATKSAIAKLDGIFVNYLLALNELITRPPTTDCFALINDDCVLEIFDRISLYDLCALAGTCKRLYELAEHFFLQKYPHLLSGSLSISTRWEGRYAQNAGYSERFSQHFQKVEISCYVGQMDENFLKVIEKNCNKNIKEISILGSSCAPAFKEGITTFLQSVESVTLSPSATIHSGVRLDGFVNHLPLLRELKLRSYGDYLKDATFVDFKCSKLETFTCNIPYASTLDHLDTLFRQNPTIKRFETTLGNNFRSGVMRKILKLPARFGNIEELFIDSKAKVDFSQIRNDFKMLDQCKNFKWLALDLKASKAENLFELGSVKSFAELHVSTTNLDRHLPTLNLLVNLKVLKVDGSISENAANSLSANLKKLEKLWFSHSYFGSALERIVAYFARNSPKLNEMQCSFYSRGEETVDVSMLTEKRKKLADAVKLVVCLKNSEIGPNVFPNGTDSELVEFKAIK